MKKKYQKNHPIVAMKADEMLKIKGGYKAVAGPLEPRSRFSWEDFEIRFDNDNDPSKNFLLKANELKLR